MCACALAEHLGEEWLEVLALILTQLGLDAKESLLRVREIRFGLSGVLCSNRLLGVGLDVLLFHRFYRRLSLLDCG